MNIKDVKNYINENLTEQISLDYIAAHMNYSPYYLSRYFKKMTGETIMEYVRRQRLRAAVSELMNESSNVCEIALKYCFESQDGFCRAFKRYYGVTPGNYKRCRVELINKSKNDYEELNYIMLNSQIYKEAKCSNDEKEKLLPVIKKILDLSMEARNEGLFSLENKIEILDNLFFQRALAMLIDGTEPDIIKERLLNYALYGDNEGYELLVRIIILEGILAIQKGMPTFMIRDMLVTFLGDNYIEESDKYFGIDHASQNKIKDKFMFSVKEKKVFSKECSLLEDPLTNMDSRSIQRLIREIDLMTLADALSGASGAIQEKVLMNMSGRQACVVIEEISSMDKIILQEVTNAQKIMLKALKILVEHGDILI